MIILYLMGSLKLLFQIIIMATLPSLGASGDYIIVSGFSAGSFMSAQLMTGWPEVFRCGGLLNGGMTYTAAARNA